jgi:hypothetical protein
MITQGQLIVALNDAYKVMRPTLPHQSHGYLDVAARRAVECMLKQIEHMPLLEQDIMQIVCNCMAAHRPLYEANTDGERLQILTNVLCQVKVMLPDITLANCLTTILCFQYGYGHRFQYDQFIYACALARIVIDNDKSES